MLDTSGDEDSNFQFAIFEINSELLNMDRDLLWFLLRSEGIHAKKPFYPGVHCMHPYLQLFPFYQDSLTTTNSLCTNLLQLPVGNKMETLDIDRISDLFDFLIRNDIAIVEKIKKDGINR